MGLSIIAGIVVILLLAAATIVIFFDINAYRHQVQAAASTALGMDVSVNGGLGLGFAPGLFITLADVEVRNRDISVATMRQVHLGIDLFPLLYQKIRINNIQLEQPIIVIERDLNGRYSFSNPGQLERTIAGSELPQISFSAGTLRYVDAGSELLLEATDCTLDARDIHVAGGKSTDLLKLLSLTGDLACGTFRKNAFAGAALKIHALAEHGDFQLDPVTMALFGGTGSGKILASFSGETPRYQLDYALPGLHAETFFLVLSDTPMLAGPMDFTMRLKMKGDTYKGVVASATGRFSLQGSQLTLTGSDLDSQLDRFETSQDFNLIDAGAFFFIGPLGLLATKGYDFARILNGSGGTSQIDLLISDWNVEQGTAEATDVAMATPRHRMALHGSLNFAAEQFQDITLALVNPHGCVKVQQKITGSFQQPVIESPGVIRSLTGPIRSLVNTGIGFFTDDNCEVFYAGRVSPPA